MKLLTVSLLVLTTAGCAATSSNLRQGNKMDYASLTDQREANRTVQVLDTAPSSSTPIGQVDAARCHRNFTESAPSEELILTDLKIAAYVRGASGITNVKISKESGLSNNCWYILTGRATAFR